MPRRLYDPVLLRKLARKINKPEKYVREQISKRARGVSPIAYFVYWLTKEGIPSAVYQRTLLNGVKNDIRTLLQNQNFTKRTPPAPQKIRRAERIFKIKEPDIQAKSPLLPNNLIKDAHGNVKIYPVLFIFENSIRYFVMTILKKKYGETWWNASDVTREIVNNDIKRKVQQRQRDERINAFHGQRGVHEIFYTDFTELATIIKNNAGAFNPLFAGIKGKISFLIQKLEELAMSRNTVAHTCPLKKTDRDRFLLYFQDWYAQLDVINSRLEAEDN